MTTNSDSAENRPYWFVGAAPYGTLDETERFLQEGVWKNGYEDRYLDIVRSMQPGDSIALKSSYRKKLNLPFDYNGRYAAVMKIKATGAITENLGDGQRVRVNWTRTEPPREWYFSQLRKTIHEIWQGSGWKSDALIRFTFEDEDQDYERFLADGNSAEVDEHPPISPSTSLSLEPLANKLLYPVNFLENVQILLDEKKQVIF